MNRRKIINLGQDVLIEIKKGVDEIADLVKKTLGPKGGFVVIEREFGNPIIVNDGVTIAKEGETKSPLKNLGVQLVKVVSSQTNENAGDGTTTVTVLAQAMLHEALKLVTTGVNPVLVAEGMKEIAEMVVAEIEKRSKKVEKQEDILNIASISASDKKIGGLISEAIEKVGKDGAIIVEDSKSLNTFLEISEGTQIDSGPVAPFMIDKGKSEVLMENPYILVTDQELSSYNDLLPILEQVVNSNTGRGLLIIAEDVKGDALTTLLYNKIRGVINTVAVKAPGFGDRKFSMLEDLAILVGAELVSKNRGVNIRKINLNSLGSAKKVTVKSKETVIIEGSGSKESVQSRMNSLLTESSATDSSFERDKLKERVGKLNGKVATIKAGGATETEVAEKKLRLEDALNATKAAIDRGIVPGGGVIFLQVHRILSSFPKLEDEREYGRKIVLNSLLYPIRQILENAGEDVNVIINNILTNKTDGLGYDVMTKKYVDMLKEGIIDPAKVSISAIHNAVSIVSMLIRTGGAITIEEEKKEQHNHSHGEGMDMF